MKYVTIVASLLSLAVSLTMYDRFSTSLVLVDALVESTVKQAILNTQLVNKINELEKRK